MNKYILCVLALFFGIKLCAQKHHDRFNSIDVTSYVFDIEINDTTDILDCTATVSIEITNELDSFYLDLVGRLSNGKGMVVSSVTERNEELLFRHQNNRLTIAVDWKNNQSKIRKYVISYSGIPADGMIISKNKFGNRTFFGDNWPDRGQNWLPIVDHPSDKATVQWIIIAPSHYKTIGNGVLIGETELSHDRKRTWWKMDQPIPTKVMVMAAAQFSVEKSGEVDGIPVSSWVYPENESYGFSDYAMAVPILSYFSHRIGAYSFESLANVQSTTRFGGMENASIIFYAEESVTGTGSSEALIAHEIAHQWFGNSATEATWHDIWLSEGFATYFTNLYFEHKYGSEKLEERIKNERSKVIRYYKKNQVPVVNPAIENYVELLNANSYEKGALILHMLRREIGDSNFWKGVQTYYKTYFYKNASSSDFQKVMEESAGKDLSVFFQQWLHEVGHPELDIVWHTKGRKKIEIEVTQLQHQFVYDFPLDLQLIEKNGNKSVCQIKVNKRNNQFILRKKGVQSLLVDPNAWLLFELRNLEKRN